MIALCGIAVASWVASLGPLPFKEAREVSTTVVDRNGKLLRAFAMADGRWRLLVDAKTDVDPGYVALLLAYTATMIVLDKSLVLPEWVRQVSLAAFVAAMASAAYLTLVRPMRLRINPRRRRRRIAARLGERRTARRHAHRDDDRRTKRRLNPCASC